MAANQTPISIYALGGLCEVGKNTYCIESDNSIIVIDAGVRFPGESLPGVNCIVPDYQHLKSSQQKLKALLITHGHEDHIGGIPYLIQSVHFPVIYAPKLAAALIKRRLDEMHIREPINIVEYDSDTELDIAEFHIRFFYVTHSIPDAYGIVVDTPQGRIVHTGDFKIDLTPVGKHIELTKIAQIGAEGVDLLLSDSTNAEIEGYTPSETTVLKSIHEIFENAQGRLILSTFSSNISRIQQIVQVAVEFGRKIAIIGRSMENVVQIARDFGYIKIPDTSIIPVEDLREYKAKEICVLCTGSQGEPVAALSRIANGDHKDLSIIPGDTVVFSSSAIPGNGVLIDKVVNKLVRKGADVLTNSILFHVHSSGHPSKQELRLMLTLMNPKYFMPIHGEYRMLKLHGEIAQQLGMPKENVFVLENGEVITLLKHKITRGVDFTVIPVYIDGRDIKGINESVLRDREILQDDGLIAVTVGISSKKGKILVDPVVVTKAFISDSTNINERIAQITKEALVNIMPGKPSFNEIKTVIKNEVTRYVYRKTERKPLVVPVVMDEI